MNLTEAYAVASVMSAIIMLFIYFLVKRGGI